MLKMATFWVRSHTSFFDTTSVFSTVSQIFPTKMQYPRTSLCNHRQNTLNDLCSTTISVFR